MSFAQIDKLAPTSLPQPVCFPFQKQVREELVSKLNSFSPKSVWEFLPTGHASIGPNYRALMGPDVSSACELSLAEESGELLLSFFNLDLLRMDQLYMFFSEARRVVKREGLLIIVGVAAPRSLLEKLATTFWCYSKKRKIFRVDHYISPEDWVEIERLSVPANSIRSEILILKRI